MSVTIDSPVHYSSSDDFAVLLEDELASGSESEDACEHPGSFGNLCILCGKILEEESGDSDMRSMEWQSQKKLCLVLDLDHTLLNSTSLKELRVDEKYLKSHTHSLQVDDVSRGNLFFVEYLQTITKLRPFVHTFLKEASQMFVMYIYTMGDRQYALEMAKLLDPNKEYFDNRIFSRDDGTFKHQKTLDKVVGPESSVLILDDTENVWPKHKENLIVIERYHFFASSCNHRFKSLSQLKSDESETNGALATLLNVLKQTHARFFQDGGGEEIRSILKQVRKEILKDCKLVFSGVFTTKSKPEDHPLWRMAKGLGAICATQVDETVTHVVAMDAGTEKVRWGIKKKKFVVHRGWIHAANYLWKKQPEENFRLERHGFVDFKY